MREATEITDEGTDYAKYGKLGQYEQYAYILKFNGEKKDQTSLFYSSFDEAAFYANYFIEKKMKRKNISLNKIMKENTKQLSLIIYLQFFQIFKQLNVKEKN